MINNSAVQSYHCLECLFSVRISVCGMYSCIGIEYVKCPVTLFHGVKDTVIPVSTALNLMQR